MRLIILPALPASAVQNEFHAIIKPITLQELKEFVEERKQLIAEVINFNRHEPTNRILAKYVSLPMKQGNMYYFQQGDVMVLVGLKTRAPKGTMDVEVREEDLALALIIPV